MIFKWAVTIIVLIILVLFGGFMITQIFNTNLDTKHNNTTKKKDALDILSISPQSPTDKVMVNSATLSKKGYLVLREIDGEKLSQVIEISKPLDKGTHENISISIGNADIANKELIVMVYEDYANDGVFNDFDRPALSESGTMTASYIKTGKPIASTITEGDGSEMMGHSMAGMQSMVKVKYTDKGFIPEKIEVTEGSMVEFINESNTDMWVASSQHPSHTDLPTFDQFKPTKKGSIYRYVFDKKGIWSYHDHINASLGGIVTVN
jgi:plastocyanin